MSSSIDVEPACLSHASKSSCCQLLQWYDSLTRSLRSSSVTSLPRYYESVRPSARHRYAGPHGSYRLGFSLGIRATGSCSSTSPPASASRPLYTGRRPLRHQAPCGLDSQANHTRLVSTTFELINDASSRVHLRSSRACSPAQVVLMLFFQRSPPRLLTAADWSGLRSAPENRARGAFPHQ